MVRFSIFMSGRPKFEDPQPILKETFVIQFDLSQMFDVA